MIQKYINIFVIVMVILVLGLSSYTYVPVGYRGIGTRFGALTGKIRGEGIHFKIPLIEGNTPIEIRVQKEEVKATAASRDLQLVTSVVAVNYAIDQTKIVDLFQGIGLEYKSRLIAPAIQEAVKATTAQFPADELITKRAQVSDQIMGEMVNKMGKYGIQITDLNVVDFDFSDSFNKAIEAKVTAEQDALAAKNKLEQIKYEAAQMVESAKGRAEALRVEGEAIRVSPEIVQLRAIEKWNGQLPQYMTGNNPPFIQIH